VVNGELVSLVSVSAVSAAVALVAVCVLVGSGISVGSGVAVGLLLLLVVEGVSAVVADGTVRNGATGAADDGRQLDPIPAKRLDAFAWQDDHGPDALLTARPD